MKRIIASLFAVFGLMTGLHADNARTLTITSTTMEGETPVAFTLEVGAGATANEVYLVADTSDRGPQLAGWAYTNKVADVAASESVTEIQASVPAGWGTTYQSLRFILTEKAFDEQLEYLNSTGKQAIDSGLVCTSKIEAELDMQMISLSANSPIFGKRVTSSSDKAKFVWWVNPSRQAALNYADYDSGYQSSLPLSTRCKLSNKNSDIYLDGVLKINNADKTFTSDSRDTIYLFALRKNHNNKISDDVDCRTHDMKLWGLKIWDDGTLVRDYIPVVKGGVAGLYDKLNKTFSTTMTTTAFPTKDIPTVESEIERMVVAATDYVPSTMKPIVNLVAATVCDDYRVKIDWDVRSMGQATTVDIYALIGNTAESLDSVKLADGVSTGTGSGYISAVEPGKTYYVSVYAVAGERTGDAAPLVQVAAPALTQEGTFGTYRGVKITGFTRTGARQTGVTLALENKLHAKLYAAYGAKFGGSNKDNWENVVKVADIEGGTTSYDYTLPQGWGVSVKFIRFFLECDDETMKIFKYLASNGGEQGIRIPRHLKGGDTFEIVWREYELPAEGTTEDKGWGTGSNGDRNVTGAGRRSLKAGHTTHLSPYIYSDHRSLVNNGVQFLNSDLTTDVTYKDVAVMSAPMSYTMTALDGANAGKVWTMPADITMPDGINYDSGSDIYLYRDNNNPWYGKKAITSAIIHNKDGQLDGYYVPAEKNSKYGFYDFVTDTFLENLSANAFVASSETRKASEMDLVGYSGTAVAEDISKPALVDDIEVSGLTVGDSVTVSGTLSLAGSGNCVITVETSSTDAFTTYATFTDGLTHGEGETYSITVTTEPGVKTYYRVRATDSASKTAISKIGSFTTKAASSVALKTAASNKGGNVTAAATVAVLGANTTYVWLEWSVGSETYANKTAVQTFDASSSSLDAPFNFTAGSYGTLYYRICCSNECPSQTWASQSPMTPAAVVNNANYTWKNAVAEGNWNDSASWDTDGVIAWYPEAASKAIFNGTTARVNLTADATVNTLTLTGVFDLTFAGAHTLTANIVAPKTSGWKFQIENANVVSTSAFKCSPVADVLFTVSGATGVFQSNGEFTLAGTSNRIEVANGAHIYPSGNAAFIGGEASVVVIDNAEFWGRAFNPGASVACTTVPPKVIMRGKDALVTVWRDVGSTVNAGAVAADWEFEVPANGFNNKSGLIPVPNSQDPDPKSEFQPKVPFGYVNDKGGKQRMAISKVSPFFREGKGTLKQQLVYWPQTGIATNLIELVKVPNGGKWYYTYGMDKANPLMEPEKEGDLPTGLWAELTPKKGLMLMVR